MQKSDEPYLVSRQYSDQRDVYNREISKVTGGLPASLFEGFDNPFGVQLRVAHAAVDHIRNAEAPPGRGRAKMLDEIAGHLAALREHSEALQAAFDMGEGSDALTVLFLVDGLAHGQKQPRSRSEWASVFKGNADSYAAMEGVAKDVRNRTFGENGKRGPRRDTAMEWCTFVSQLMAIWEVSPAVGGVERRATGPNRGTAKPSEFMMWAQQIVDALRGHGMPLPRDNSAIGGDAVRLVKERLRWRDWTRERKRLLADGSPSAHGEEVVKAVGLMD